MYGERSWSRKDGGSEKRKRAVAEDYFDQNPKRARLEDEQEAVEDRSPERPQERKVRGSPGDSPLNLHNRDFPKSFVTRHSLPSILHPNCRPQLGNRETSHNGDYPLSPLSRSPEHAPEGLADEESKSTRAYASVSFDTDHPRQPSRGPKGTAWTRDTRLNTARTSNQFDSKNPEHNSLEMASGIDKEDETIRHPSKGARRDSHEGGQIVSTTLSRRASEAMAPPPQSAIIKPTRSESSTPRTATPAINTQISFPRRRSMSQTSILEDLTNFAQSITSTATLSVKQDSIKEQATSQERQRDRQQRHKQHFITLIEDSETRADCLNRAVGRLEKQVQYNSGIQAILAAELASSIERRSMSPSKAGTQDNTSINRDISRLRAELRDLDEDFRDFRRKANKHDDIEKRRLVTKDDLRTQISDALIPTRKLLSRQSEDVSRLSRKLSDLVSVYEQRHQRGQENETMVGKRLDDLDGGVAEIRARVATAENIIKRLDVGISETQTNFAGSHETLRKLDAFVRGDDEVNEPGLRALIQEEADQNLKTRGLLDRLNEQIQGLESKSAEDDNRFAYTLEAAKKNSTPSLDMDGIRQNINALVRAQHDHGNSTISEEVATIRGDLEILKEEQDGKDACVTSDFERLETLVNQQAEELKALRQSQASNARINPPPTPPLATMPFRAENLKHQKIQEIETGLRHLTNQVTALDAVFNTQQQKFEGLTSDHVLSSMILYLRSTYPSIPANVAIQVGEVIQSQISLDTRQKALETKQDHVDFFITSLSPTLDNMKQEVTAATNASLETRTFLSKQANDLGSLRQQISKLKGTTLDDETRERLASLDDRLADMLKKIDGVEEDHAAMSAGLSTKVGNIVSDVNALKIQLDSVKWTKERLEEKEKDFAVEGKIKSIQSGADMQSDSSVNSDSDAPLGVRRASKSLCMQESSTPERKRKRTSATRVEDEDIDVYENRHTVGKGQRRNKS
ncbi:hypothetical protein N7G274_005540 [Stereocaulon virgatum]|uniref:Uncharacterized protein n=1 Tax=Stereocaulon virgatum TaxID=373712 RepID=A0ABR4A8L4_9LECA